MVKRNVFKGCKLGIAIGITILVLLLVGGAGAVPVEQWNRTYDGSSNNNDFGYSAQRTSDGGYIIAALTHVYYPNGASSNDAWLIKTDANGTMQWNSTFGGGNDEFINFAQQTSDGGYMAVGWTSSYGAGGLDAWLIKTDANGKEQWNRTFGTKNFDDAWFARQTSDGGYVLTGGTYSYGDGGYDAWVIKTDSNGIEQWNRTYRTNTRGQSIRQTPDGGYIIAGRTYPFGASYNSDAYLLKIDSNGTEQWNNTYGRGGYEDAAYSIDLIPDGSYVFAGTTSGYGASANDAWLVKVNDSGVEQWNRTFGGADYDYGYFVQRTSDNGYVVAGLTSAYSTSGNKGWLVKFDENGNKLWDMSFGGITRTDQIYSVQQTLDGGYILAGSTQTYATHFTDAWLIKVSNDTDMSTLPPTLETITTSPTSVILNTTETQTFTATALDQDSKPMPGINISWTVSNSTVGNIDALYGITDTNGNVSTTFTAIAIGTTNVTATNRTVSGWQTVTVTEPTSTPTPTPTPIPTPTPTPSPSPIPTPITDKPEVLPGFNQFKSDGVTVIEVNNKTMGRTVIFTATPKDPNNHDVKIQIELRRTDENGGNFDENLPGLKNSSLVSSGSEVTVTVKNLIDSNYHWRVRAIDKYENVGDWQELEDENNHPFPIDFIISQNNHWVAVIPVQLGTPNRVDYQAIVKRSNDLATYYKQQSYGKENMKVDILLNGNYAYTSDTYQTYLTSKGNNVEKARQQIVSDAIDYVSKLHISLVPYDSLVVVFTSDANTEKNYIPVSCNLKSRYPDINGGPSCQKSWSLISEDKLSSLWVHEVGHALFDFTDKYNGYPGGEIYYWGIMGRASQSGEEYSGAGKWLAGVNPLSPLDPISKRDAGWIDGNENSLKYATHQPINLINGKGVYFFNPDGGDHGYIIEGRNPPDEAIYDGWCPKSAKKCDGETVKSNPLQKTKGILIYDYHKHISVQVPNTETVYAVDQISNIANPAVGKGDTPQNTVTLVPSLFSSKSTFVDSGIRFHVSQSLGGQLYLDISKI